MPDLLEQDPTKRRLFEGTNVLGHETEIGLPGARELGDVASLSLPAGPGAGAPGATGAAPIGARPGEELHGGGPGVAALQMLGLGSRVLGLGQQLGRGQGPGQAAALAGDVPDVLSKAGITPQEFSELEQMFGPLSPGELALLNPENAAALKDIVQSRLLLPSGGLSASGAETAAREGVGAGTDFGVGGGGSGLGTAAMSAAITALLNSIAGEPASSAFLSELGASLAAGGGSALGAAAIPVVYSLLNAFGLDRPSPYQMTREGDALRMSARLPLAAYGIMSARSPEELTRVLQEQEFTRKDQNTYWSEADLINTLKNDPMALNVLTGNYHLDEAGIDQQINQLTKLAALKMQGGDTVNIPGWEEARAMLEKQVFGSPAVMMPWTMPGYGMPPTAGGDPWANYSTLAAGPTTYFGDPFGGGGGP